MRAGGPRSPGAARRGGVRRAVGEVPPGRRPVVPGPRVAGAGRRAGHGQDDAGPRRAPESNAGGPPASFRRQRPQPPLDRRPHRRARHRRRDARAHPPGPATSGRDGRAGRGARPHRESIDADGHWVVATIGKQRSDRDPDLTTLLSLFPWTIEVPPLRHHVEDVAELVPHLLGRLARGGNLGSRPR